MSGPKTSRYTLTPEQRRALEEQRRAESALRVADKTCTLADGEVIRLDETLVRMEKLHREADLAKARALRQQVMEAVQQARQMKVPDGSEAIGKASRQVQQALQQMQAEAACLADALPEAEASFRQELSGKMAHLGDFASAMASAAPNPVQEKRDALLCSLQQAGIGVADEGLRQRIAQVRRMVQGAEDLTFLRNAAALNVTPLVKECAAWRNAWEAHGAAFTQMKLAYEEAMRALGETPEDVSFSMENVARLQQLLAEADARRAELEEQAYISRCMDEALAELGYDLLGSREVTRRSGRHFRNALYHFEEGTAVSVTYADDGQITLELGGLDDTDRLPTLREGEALAEDMEAFCVDFHAIEARLAARGITAKRLSILPAEAQYAQIFNVGDYDMRGPVTHYEAPAQKRPQGQKKQRRVDE